MASNISADQFLAAAKYRRTVYALKDTSSVSDARIEEIVQEVLSFAPSSYNTQSARISLVLGQKHKQLWDEIIQAAQPILENVGAWDAMGPRLHGFKNAYGSVLFFESEMTIKEAQNTHKSAAHMFPEWSEHATGMHQILVWTALELEGLGANLQHLNAIPPVEVAIKKYSGFTTEEAAQLKLKAHLNFGDEAAPHPEKPAKLPISQTLKIVK